MTDVVSENWIKCKYLDRIEVCPVDCLYESQNVVVIHPAECTGCGVCVPDCPAQAIVSAAAAEPRWLELKRRYASLWLNITIKKSAPPDADALHGVPGGFRLFSPEAGNDDAADRTEPGGMIGVADGHASSGDSESVKTEW